MMIKSLSNICKQPNHKKVILRVYIFGDYYPTQHYIQLKKISFDLVFYRYLIDFLATLKLYLCLLILLIYLMFMKKSNLIIHR